MNSRMVDVTETSSDRHSNVARGWVVTPVLEKNTVIQIERDDISASLKYESIFDFQEKHEKTPLNSEQEVKVAIKEFSSNGGDIEANPIDNVSEDRITLLARKYATKHVLPEDAARLDILTQRFRNAMPAITEKDLEIMEDIQNKLNSAMNLNNRLQEKYK